MILKRGTATSGLSWIGYKVHLSETCDQDLPRLITNVHTTVAITQDVAGTAEIHASLSVRRLLSARHFVDAGYINAELLVESLENYDIELFGTTRFNPSWQTRTDGYDTIKFSLYWDQIATCSEGRKSIYWHESPLCKRCSHPTVKVKFKAKDCFERLNQSKCIKTETKAAFRL